MKCKKQLMTIVSASVFACILCSCGRPEDKLLGTWSTSYDMVPLMEEASGEDFEGFEAPSALIYLTFEDDGTYQMQADRTMLADTIEEWKKAVSEYYVNKTYEQMEEKGYTKEQTEALFKKTYECSCREYMDTIVDENVDEDEMIDMMSVSGYYKVTSDNLFFGNPDISENTYDLYTIKENELILNPPDQETANGAALIGEFEYPLVFTRVAE